MFIVGLTGGIGSGKTTVANLFAQYGIPIIDADIIAREVVIPESSAFSKLVHHFGQSILTEKGDLDRKKLRHLIFNNPKERQWLENLLHPLIREEIEKKIKQLPSASYCIVVIPLLYEVKSYPFIDRVLLVDTPEHLQISRVVDRDKVDHEHVKSILKTQLSREDRQTRANDIIINDGKLEDLITQVKKLHKTYLEMKLTE